MLIGIPAVGVYQNSVLVRYWHMAHTRRDETKANVHSILLCTAAAAKLNDASYEVSLSLY